MPNETRELDMPVPELCERSYLSTDDSQVSTSLPQQPISQLQIMSVTLVLMKSICTPIPGGFAAIRESQENCCLAVPMANVISNVMLLVVRISYF